MYRCFATSAVRETQTKPHSEAPFQTCGCGSIVKKHWQEWTKPKVSCIASGSENGPTVPQNVKQLRSDLPITSLGHTEKGENHSTSKLVHTVSQAPDRTGNVPRTRVSQSLWTKRGISSFSCTQWNNPKSYSTTIWSTGHITYWSCIIKHHIYTLYYGNEAAMYWARRTLMNHKNAMFSEETQAGTLEHTSMYF